MCGKCDSLRRQITAARRLSGEITDPVSILFNKAELRALEERLAKVMREHHPSDM